MKLGIMQPYFFPYLGYWQLIRAVDKFVILDDVNYIVRGYINRNTILINNRPHMFSISIENPSQNRLIKETKLFFPEKEREKLIKTLQMAYHRAPFCSEVFPMIKECILYPSNELVSFLMNALLKTAEYLDIKTKFILSSEIKKNNEKKAQDKIIEINKIMGADEYINAIGGQSLYDREMFSRNNIVLHFIKMKDHNYQQYGKEFVPNLSIIDIMMFNSRETIDQMLLSYDLI